MAEIVNFGCRLNAYEAQVMRAHAEAAGLDNAIIVNTCTVTAEAERQARQTIRKLRRENPSARIVVTGCAVQVDPARFAAMTEVDRVLGNQEKLDPAAWLGNERLAVADIMTVKETAAHLVAGFDGRARAFLQVQNGCDHRCTFCVIPFGRGNNRSVPLGLIVEQARALVAQGYAEIVLTGVDLTAYGADLPGQPTLGQAVKRLLDLVPDLARLRLSSLDVVEIDDTLMGLIGDEPRLMPHLHLSLQAGDDMILKRMKRRHLRQQAIDFCAEARRRRPDIVFGADLIAGFPTETEAMFENSLKLVEDCGLTYLHVFPYSARQGTPAARMPQLPGPVRKERAGQLRAAGDAALQRYLASRVGSAASVLIEAQGQGHDAFYAPAIVDGPTEPGRVVSGRVIGAMDGRLQVRLAA